MGGKARRWGEEALGCVCMCRLKYILYENLKELIKVSRIFQVLQLYAIVAFPGFWDVKANVSGLLPQEYHLVLSRIFRGRGLGCTGDLTCFSSILPCPSFSLFTVTQFHILFLRDCANSQDFSMSYTLILDEE